MDWKANVLVVANVTAASGDLLAALTDRAARGPAEFTLLLPATGGDRAGARRALEQAVDRMSAAGLDVTGSVGDSDPVVAVHEAWDPRRYDEIVVSTLPAGVSRWLQVDLPHRIERMTDCTVTHVVSKPPQELHPTYEPPPKPKHMGLLTPLEALGWGGKGRGQDQAPRR